MSEVIGRDDPDLVHLLRLLALLPLPDDDEFWSKFAAMEGDSRAKTYVLDKVSAHVAGIERDGDTVARGDVVALASCVLMLFAAPTPAQVKLLDQVAKSFVADMSTRGRRYQRAAPQRR